MLPLTPTAGATHGLTNIKNIPRAWRRDTSRSQGKYGFWHTNYKYQIVCSETFNLAKHSSNTVLVRATIRLYMIMNMSNRYRFFK